MHRLDSRSIQAPENGILLLFDVTIHAPPRLGRHWDTIHDLLFYAVKSKGYEFCTLGPDGFLEVKAKGLTSSRGFFRFILGIELAFLSYSC